ncbi:MAG: inositol monophosphatase family protein [Alphaproteobacteria bacterium]
MAHHSADITVMVRAAEKAARSLVRDFGEVENLQVSRKGPGDFVSVADKQAESIIHDDLSYTRPGYGFLMEESGEIKGDGEMADNRFIIDPLDGTTNFLHGLPHWCISIGLERDGVISAGVIYDPIKDEMFWSEKGAGCFVNKRRCRVSARRDPETALFSTGQLRTHVADETGLRRVEQVMDTGASVRRYGAGALDIAYVAAGRFDGFWEVGLKPWDMAAGTIMIQESGGYIGEIGGGKNHLYAGNVFASNLNFRNKIGKILRGEKLDT